MDIITCLVIAGLIVGQIIDFKFRREIRRRIKTLEKVAVGKLLSGPAQKILDEIKDSLIKKSREKAE